MTAVTGRGRPYPAPLKRSLDVTLSSLGMLAASPVLMPVTFLVWLQDRRSPFYVAERVGMGGKGFRMVKLRSMVVGADRSGVDSTAADDARITPIGQFIRRYKLDELTQLWNVLTGDMSLVGPRPNVRRETDLYTAEERRLLSVKPGITDLASIVFADEGEILAGSSDPDMAYHQLIRPGKNRLGLFYLDQRSLALDLRLIFLTGVAVVSRSWALRALQRLLRELGATPDLIAIAARETPLVPMPPPGANEIVISRDETIA